MYRPDGLKPLVFDQHRFRRWGPLAHRCHRCRRLGRFLLLVRDPPAAAFRGGLGGFFVCFRVRFLLFLLLSLRVVKFSC
jgi:hypothetical protein